MHWKNSLWFSRRPVIFNDSLENQNTRLENQMAYSVNCSGKFVFGFQDDLCSLGLLENQIELFDNMHFWEPNRDTPNFELNK